MKMIQEEPKKSFAHKFLGYCTGLLPFISLPVLGSMLYLRHDDSSWLLWAKKFTNPLLYAFSSDPAVNMTQGFNQEIYWRPFVNLYILGVYHLLGPAAAGAYHVIACITFILAVFLLLRLADRYAGLTTAVITGLLFFVVFNGVMYNLFHVGVPVSFLFQMGLIYFFWRYLETGRWPAWIAALLFLVPAMARQTSPILIAGLLLAYLISNRKSIITWKSGLALLLIIAGFYMLTFSHLTKTGSVASVLNDPIKLIEFYKLRIHYYGSYLSGGISGFFMLFLFSGGLFYRITKRMKWEIGIKRYVWALPTLLATGFFLRFPTAGIFWIIICMIVLFLADAKLRMPLAWAGASLAAFFSIEFYHMGYLVEAAFPLSLTLSILSISLFRPLYAEIKRSAKTVRWAAGAAAVLVILVVLGLSLARRIPFVTSRLDTVSITVEKSRNFKAMMVHLYKEIPENAVLYELNEYDLGLTGTHVRFFTPVERAKKVKVMNLLHKREMFDLNDRADIEIRPAWQLPGRDLPDGSFLITCSGFERNIAENRYDLSLIKAFGDSDVSCALFAPAVQE